MIDTRTRDELISDAYPLISIASRKFRVPAGLSHEDLESAGNEAILEAATKFDSSVPWRKWAYLCIKNAMRAAIAKHRRHPVGHLQQEFDGVELPPPVDPRAADPSDRAAIRESFERKRIRHPIHTIRSKMPDPVQVASQVSQLRNAMFSSISRDDVEDVMRSVVESAKSGDLRAAKLLMDLLAPARSGVKINQQAIVIQHSDLG